MLTNPTSPGPDLEQGTLVTFLLSESVPALRFDLTARTHGRRAASGRVVGYAVRSRKALDLQLNHISTWITGRTPWDREFLPSTARVTVRVEIQKTLECTFRLLRDPGIQGRAGMLVLEIPWQKCWHCARDVTKGHRFCVHCGTIVSLGTVQPRPVTVDPSTLGTGSCEGCWRVRRVEDLRCPHCGHSRVLDERIERLIEQKGGVRGRFCLVERGRRVARIQATIRGARVERRFSAGGMQLIVELHDVDLEGAATDLVLPAGPGFAMEVAIRVPHGRVPETAFKELATQLLGGLELRAAEISRACPCSGRMADDLYCTHCGTRARLVRRTDRGRRRRGRATVHERAHACGASYHAGRDQYCGACGDRIGADAETDVRFAMLG